MPISETYNMDCLEAMRGMPDKAFDLAIVDPPYGIGRHGQQERFTRKRQHKRKYFAPKDWDSCTPTNAYFRELFRVAKNQIVWGANYFPQHLTSAMGWVFWDKGQSLSMSDGELAFTSFHRALRRIVLNRNVLAREGTIHPTQKPIALYKWLLINYAKPGDRILDTHLGSQSSRIAAWDLGFDFVGYELDPDYFREGNERFERHRAQGTLFAPEPITAEQAQLFETR